MSGVKGIIRMHRFNICLVIVLLWCENTISDTVHRENGLSFKSAPPPMLCVRFNFSTTLADRKNEAVSLIMW